MSPGVGFDSTAQGNKVITIDKYYFMNIGYIYI